MCRIACLCVVRVRAVGQCRSRRLGCRFVHEDVPGA
jgi:hypothetical protein